MIGPDFTSARIRAGTRVLSAAQRWMVRSLMPSSWARAVSMAGIMSRMVMWGGFDLAHFGLHAVCGGATIAAFPIL